MVWKKNGESIVLYAYNRLAERDFPRISRNAIDKDVQEVFIGYSSLAKSLTNCFMENNEYDRFMTRIIGSNIEFEGYEAFRIQNDKILMILANFSQRSRREQQLIETESKYRILVETALQGIAIIQCAPLAILYANPGMKTIWGYDPDEFIALHPTQIDRLFHPDDRINLIRYLWDRLKGQETMQCCHVRGIHKNGSIIWLQVLGSKIMINNQPALQTIFVDTTERIQAEKAKRDAIQRSLFYLDVLSHDVINQLQIIAGRSEILLTSLQDKQARKQAQDIMNAVKKCSSMISKVRMTASLIATPITNRYLDATVKKILEEFKQKYPNVTFYFDSPKHSCIVKADKFLELMIENVIENAIVHNQNRDKQVWVSIIENRDFYRLQIADNASGIARSLREKIFRVESRSGGIGLFQVHQIVEKYNGKIEIADRVEGFPSEGTVFRIDIPGVTEPSHL